MLFSIVGIVMNIFKTQYINKLSIEDFESQKPMKEFNGPNISNITPREVIDLTNQAISSFYIGMIISIAISIVVIVLISQFFTKRLVKRIMIPVNKLIEANKKVENGNYNEEIKYKGEYEFEQLCNSFNNMQKTLKEEKELNKKEQKSKEDMIAGISHDLRTPLTSIKGYIKGIKDGVASSKEKQKQYLDVAYNKACEMDILIEKLFELSQLETGDYLYDFKLEHVGNFVDEYIGKQEKYLEDSNVAMLYHYPTKRIN